MLVWWYWYIYSLRSIKKQPVLDVVHSSTTNLNISLSRFIILECVTFSPRFVFWDGGSRLKQKKEKGFSLGWKPDIFNDLTAKLTFKQTLNKEVGIFFFSPRLHERTVYLSHPLHHEAILNVENLDRPSTQRLHFL